MRPQRMGRATNPWVQPGGCTHFFYPQAGGQIIQSMAELWAEMRVEKSLSNGSWEVCPRQ